MSDEKQYPSFAEQSANLAGTAYDILKGIMQGQPVYASEEVQEQRKEICKTCDKNDGLGKCMECGCMLEWKIPWAMSDCPAKKWDFDDVAFKEHFIKNLDNNTKSS